MTEEVKIIIHGGIGFSRNFISMERRMIRNYHVRCGVGEKTEIISKFYLSLYSDGGHIRLLLLTLFSKCYRPLLEKGHLYVPEIPLYKATKYVNGQATYKFYSSEAEINKERAELLAGGYVISRFKGLGEMDPAEVAMFTTDKENRKLKQLTYDDIADVLNQLNILMGNDSALRKDWVSDNIDYDELYNSL